MHDAKASHPLLVVVAQLVIGAVRTRELGLAATLRDPDGGEHSGHLRALIIHRRAAVDMPVEGRTQIRRRRVFRLVQGDRIDTRDRMVAVRRVVDDAESAAKRHLRFRIQLKSRKGQYAVLLERIEYRITEW